MNHVIPDANILSTDLAGATGYTNTMATGPNSTALSLYFDGTSGVVFNGYSEVEIPNVSTENGIVHIVDCLLYTSDAADD